MLSEGSLDLSVMVKGVHQRGWRGCGWMYWDLDAEQLQRQGRPGARLCGDGKETGAGQAQSRDSWSHQKLEGSTLKPLEGTSPADNQSSDFWPPEPRGINMCVVLSPLFTTLLYRDHRKQL